MKQILFAYFLLFSLAIQAQDTTIINIDFGNSNNQSDGQWNNITNQVSGSIANLLDQRGRESFVGIEVYDRFNGINNQGNTMVVDSLNIPSTASGDSFFGNRDSFSNRIELTGGVRLTGLDTALTYELSIFASRNASDNRETQYNISSSRQDTAFLNVASNTDRWVHLQGLRPKSDGSIEIEATTGPNNTNNFGFFYLGMLRLKYERANTPPLERQLRLLSPTAGAYWQPGKQPEIRWNSRNIANIKIEYSTDLGENWQLIDEVAGREQRLAWTVPNTPSKNCLVRISSDSLLAQTLSPFEIAAEDTANCHIVVLGSSTAAGTGPSTRDSAWVWRYRDYLFQKDTRFSVTNLALGGFTTYNILPTGTPIPAGINKSVDTIRNVTKALSLNPDGIIINLPSNDAANSYPVEDQLRNYDLIMAPIQVPLWVCTPQPRNNFNANQVMIQLDLVDSTFARFGAFTIDFWNEFQAPNNWLSGDFDSGDGVHMNDAGHRKLLERVLAVQVDTFLLRSKEGISTGLKSFSSLESPLQLAPNPAKNEITFSLELNTPAKLSWSVYDLNGRLVKQSGSIQYSAGEQQWRCSIAGWASGIYRCQVLVQRGAERAVQVGTFMVD